MARSARSRCHAQRTFPSSEIFAELTHIPDPLLPVAIVIFVAVGLYVLSGRPLAKLHATALLCAHQRHRSPRRPRPAQVCVRPHLARHLGQNNPSFIHDSVYGFNFFHGGPGYASFPSGHLSLTCAVMSVLWIAYPKFRALYALVVLAVVVGLVGANYHFLSDIIAGGFVGISTGMDADGDVAGARESAR